MSGMQGAGFAAALAAVALTACANAPRTPAGEGRTVDLAVALEAGRLRPDGREATTVAGEPGVVRLDEREGYGVAWLDDVELGDGVIELGVRGRDVDGASFVGIAFHGVNESTYEGIYLRPFNFRQEDPVRRQRAVQYISHPANTWRVLRERFPGRYEAAIVPAPDPSDWVRLRLEIAHPTLEVYVDGAPEPALVVEQLGGQGAGRVGLWVGNPSPGDFARLRVVPRPR